MYYNSNMRIYGLREIVSLQEILKTIIGYFWCYPDNTEEMILINPSVKEIEEKYNAGIFVGEEFALSTTPMLFYGNIVVFDNKEKGIVSYYDKDPQRLAVYTNKGNIYPLTLFDDDLVYCNTKGGICVEKIGYFKDDNGRKSVIWTWEKYKVKEDITIEELSFLAKKMVVVL